MIVLGKAELYIVVINPIRDQPVKELNAKQYGKNGCIHTHEKISLDRNVLV
jgi:hypothetical protein